MLANWKFDRGRVEQTLSYQFRFFLKFYNHILDLIKQQNWTWFYFSWSAAPFWLNYYILNKITYTYNTKSTQLFGNSKQLRSDRGSTLSPQCPIDFIPTSLLLSSSAVNHLKPSTCISFFLPVCLSAGSLSLSVCFPVSLCWHGRYWLQGCDGVHVYVCILPMQKGNKNKLFLFTDGFVYIKNLDSTIIYVYYTLYLYNRGILYILIMMIYY